VFIRFKALLMEPTAFAYAERHDNIEAIYKKLTERRDALAERRGAHIKITAAGHGALAHLRGEERYLRAPYEA
jgi:hypothetical protein